MVDNLPDYTQRRGKISAYGRALASSRRLNCLFIGLGIVFYVLLVPVLVNSWPFANSIITLSAVALLLLIPLGLWKIYRFVKQHFVEPDLAFRMWLQQVCDGELNARIDLSNFHTTNLALSLSRLSDDMDTLVESQTKRLKDQKRVLELLFKVTAEVSSESEDNAALETVVEHLADWFQSPYVSCHRVVDDKDALSCVAVRSAVPQSAEVDSAGQPDSTCIGVEQFPSRITTMAGDGVNATSKTWVPFFAGDEPAGVLIIEIPDSHTSDDIETRRVLSTVSEQLSLLCSKRLVQSQMLQARLSRDRNELAAEIHDSLAQTLLAVRYQATLLSEKLKANSDLDSYKDVLKISGSIEEANEEIRGLIRENRNPLSEHRYAESLQVVIDQFSQSSGISVFFQSDDPGIRFVPREESVLQRIIGEALNNARKYANATMIRVFLQRSESGVRSILIEDDGIGFQQAVSQGSSSIASNDTGEQIGLTIMRERALSIGAKLTIDSEPGEGTRISVTMPPMIESRREST